MIDSTPAASGAVADQRTARTPQPVVEADAGGEAEEAHEHPLTQTRHGARPVTFQGEQVLAGPEDRFDALADGRQVRAASGFVLARRPRHGDAEISSPGGELTPGVALVADEHLTAAGRARQQLERDLTLVAAGMRQRECSGRAVRRAERVQAHSPEPARVRRAVAVAGDLDERRTLRGLAAAPALDRGRVDEQQLIAAARTLRGEVGQEPLDRVRQAPATLVVAGLGGQNREEMAEALARHREEPAVAADAHDRLGHAEGDHFGVAEPPAGVASRFWQEIVGCAINDRAESVEVGVHRGLQADGDLGTVGFGLSALLSLDTADLVESII